MKEYLHISPSLVKRLFFLIYKVLKGEKQRTRGYHSLSEIPEAEISQWENCYTITYRRERYVICLPSSVELRGGKTGKYFTLRVLLAGEGLQNPLFIITIRGKIRQTGDIYATVGRIKPQN